MDFNCLMLILFLLCNVIIYAWLKFVIQMDNLNIFYIGFINVGNGTVSTQRMIKNPELSLMMSLVKFVNFKRVKIIQSKLLKSSETQYHKQIKLLSS